MNRFGFPVVLTALTAVVACGGGSPHKDSAADQRAACAHVIADAKDAYTSVLAANDNASQASAFSTMATEIRDAVSGLTSDDVVRKDAERLAALYDQTAASVKVNGLTASSVPSGVNDVGVKIDADCHE